MRNIAIVCVALLLGGCQTTTQAARPYMEEAHRMEGMDAKTNRKELKHYMNSARTGTVDPLHIPWCAGWANAVLQNNGVQGTHSLMARSFLKWGHPTHNPQEGDIVVLRRGRAEWSGHVGFFKGYEVVDGVTYVKVLGGNTDKSVAIGYFPTNYVLAFRAPNYSPKMN